MGFEFMVASLGFEVKGLGSAFEVQLGFMVKGFMLRSSPEINPSTNCSSKTLCAKTLKPETQRDTILDALRARPLARSDDLGTRLRQRVCA